MVVKETWRHLEWAKEEVAMESVFGDADDDAVKEEPKKIPLHWMPRKENQYMQYE